MILPLLAFSLIGTAVGERVLQISDFHYDVDYSQLGVRSEKCHEVGGKQPDKLGKCGDYICDSPKCLVEHTLNAAKKILATPDYVLWTGDNIPHIDNYDEKYVENSVRTVTDLVATAFGNVVVLPLFGNHDYAPANAFPDENCTIYASVFEQWKRWIKEESQETFLKGGYYKYMLPTNVLVLALNTNLYYRFNSAKASFVNPNDPADQFKFMTDNLEEARRKGMPVHIIAHIAPGVFERTPNFTWMFPEYNQKFIDITVNYSSTIKSMIFGHHHTDTFHVVKDPATGKPVQVYLMAPAVTPWFSTLDGAGANNPAFRILEYNTTSQDLLDVKTYYVDLNELNEDVAPDVDGNWTEEYSMTQAYNIDRIDGASMNSVLQRMKTDDILFLKYIEYNSVRWNYSMPVGEFRSAQLCSIEFPDFDGYNACMERDIVITTTERSSSTALQRESTSTTSSSTALQRESTSTTSSSTVLQSSAVLLALSLLQWAYVRS